MESGWRDAVRIVDARARGPRRNRPVASDSDDDPGQRWFSVLGLGESGAMLVRPDGHVAWRSEGPVDVDALGVAVDSALCISSATAGTVASGR
ncbi:hypothetical protein HQP42_15375 [Rhodococcus fascians]|nr:hypothetical protein [Rhodococcus fascians]MBY3826525.1 hypothetical protein [Rhodococcus fascians]MBY3836986.1 hypothetical protein [Rhodococcus fascians]MBY3865547.1 hypothetical protein [Rhodococcus fascians]MBY3885668.1 hypothetical protein [Rhodococcus fascians]